MRERKLRKVGTQRSYDFLGKVWRVWPRKRGLFSRKCLRLLITNLFLWHDKLETIKTCKLIFLWDWIFSVIAFHKMMLYLLYLCLFVVLIRVILYGLIQLLKCYDYCHLSYITTTELIVSKRLCNPILLQIHS